MTDEHISLELISALRDPASYPHPVKSVGLMETHISWVLLAGRYAYKIKKPVDLGFLDFSQLTARRVYCEEEIRLNRRLAPGLYLEAIPIGGTPQHPLLGDTPAIEYAVRMRRFAARNMMAQLLLRQQITGPHIDLLAEHLAQFHAGLAPAGPDSGFGSLEVILQAARQNFQQLTPLCAGHALSMLNSLAASTEMEFAACQPLMEQRRQAGYVRECHGDLHVGNIMLQGQRLIPFDSLEFDARLRWIDVMSEMAFLVMDLMHHARPDLAWRLLNVYLQSSGDYAGLGVLRFYLGYRAMVRAKVQALEAKGQISTACLAYLELASDCLVRRQPGLIITHGLPGCGKTTFTQVALEKLQAIRIRSDVERKRLFGLAPLASSVGLVPGGIYQPAATRKTYARMRELAHALLQQGFTVIVDAAFLKRAERERFSALALALNVPYVIVAVSAQDSLLRQRIEQRRGRDASEADVEVLERLQAGCEPLTSDELTHAVAWVNEGHARAIGCDPRLWLEIQRRLHMSATGE